MSTPTAHELTEQQQSLALQKIQDNKIRQASTAQYVEDVKSSMLFRPGFNWNDLLSAAPVSVSLLASLFVASTIPDATEISIIPPDGGFKCLQNMGPSPALNACLVQCADAGAKSFAQSANCFDMISLSRQTIKNKVNEIIKLLGDAESAKTLLVPTIKQLASVANECEENARQMESTFQMWLDMVCELHMCVVQTSSDTAEKRTANQVHLAAAKTRLASTEEAAKLASDSVATLKKSLDTATNAYKKAADEFPSGWDLVAQQFVSDLSETLNNAINLAVPALIENYSTTAKVEKGVDLFEGLEGKNGGAKGGSVGDGKADHTDVPKAHKVPPPVPSATLPYPNDPAYGVIGHIRSYVATILSFIVGGKDHGVDWDLLLSTDPEKQNSGLGVMVSLLQSAQDDFKPSQNPPSKELESLLSDVKKVTDGLQKAIDANKAINGSALPDPKSKEVADWRNRMQVSLRKAVELDTDSKCLASASSPPAINQTQAQSNPTDKKGAFRQQIIDAATTKLNTTSAVMNTAMTNYQESSKKLVDVQLQIGEIQASLAGLEAANVNLGKIKAILVKCIEILVQLKTQINRLVAFFSAVNMLTDHVVEQQVKPFITNLGAITGTDQQLSILNFSFTDYQRQMIFNSSLNIRAYFDLFKDIADMYLEVYQVGIKDGLALVNTMQAEYNDTTDPKEMQKKLNQRNKQVSDFTQCAMSLVKEVIGKKQQQISDNLQSNAADAARSLSFVPVKPPSAVHEAINTSTQKTVAAAKEGIQASSKYLTRQFSDTSSLVDDS